MNLAYTILLIALFSWGEFEKEQQTNWSYADDAVKILDDGSIISGSEAIKNYYRNNTIKVDSLWTIFKVKASSRYNYEIGGFKSGENYYRHLIITTSTETPERVLEFISKAGNVSWPREEIDRRRQKWMEYCNNHQVEDLVRKVYAKEPIYYNHKPVITDTESLIAEYSYMKNPSYSLKLTPEHLEMVNETLAIEIGQCSGGYSGKYILIWQREGGVWYVMADSNI